MISRSGSPTSTTAQLRASHPDVEKEEGKMLQEVQKGQAL